MVWFDSVFETPFARSLGQTGKNTLIGTLLLNIDWLSVKTNLEQLVNTEQPEGFWPIAKQSELSPNLVFLIKEGGIPPFILLCPSL